VSSDAMAETTTTRSCTVLARAKLNLSLRVLAPEPSGYHQIETVFCLIELADELEITVGGDDVVLDVRSPADHLAPPPDLGPVETNLAYRAAVLFREHTGVREGVGIRLYKRVPHGAGLGGGSSDAAAVLAGLNSLHGGPLPEAQLIQLAAALGSDVPFFVAGAPLAFAWDRGGRMAPLSPLPSKPVLLALSDNRIATADAYTMLDTSRRVAYGARAGVLRVCALRWDELARAAVNDFENVVFDRLPQLGVVRATLEQRGALLARLTGTGSAVFGVFDDADTLSAARADLVAQFPNVRFVTTATATR
jgi:4-diphosphocytidyl-2-C-methyl-D-erythritol kinase